MSLDGTRAFQTRCEYPGTASRRVVGDTIAFRKSSSTFGYLRLSRASSRSKRGHETSFGGALLMRHVHPRYARPTAPLPVVLLSMMRAYFRDCRIQVCAILTHKLQTIELLIQFF